MLEKIRAAVSGKKTYILGCVGIATALVTWSMSEITLVEFASAIFIALQTMFVRAGVAKVENVVLVETESNGTD